MWEQISSKKVKTRKPHKCAMCTRTVPAGRTMRAEVNKDNYIYRLYTCETCDTLTTEFTELFDEYGLFPSGCVGEVLRYDESSDTVETPEMLLLYLRANGITSEF